MVSAVCLFAVAVNLPGGYYRAATRKFSWRWFLAIHLPVFPLAWVRIISGVSWNYFPLFLVASALGQWIGGLIWQRSARRVDHSGSGNL